MTCTCRTFSTAATSVVVNGWHADCPVHGEGSEWLARVVADALAREFGGRDA